MSYTKTRKIEAYLDPLESNEGDMRRKEYTLRHSTSTKKTFYFSYLSQIAL